MATLDQYLNTADQSIVDVANQQADAYGIPRNIFQALISVESSWNPDAKAKNTSAYGLTQLTNAAASDVGVNQYDMLDNLKGGAEYLSKQYAASNDWNIALQRYYGGPNGYKNNPDSKAYADKIMALSTTAQGNGSTMTGLQPESGLSPLPKDINQLYTQIMGNQLKPGETMADKASQVFNNSGPVKFVKEQVGNISFIVLGIVIVAAALAWGNKETIIQMVK